MSENEYENLYNKMIQSYKDLLLSIFNDEQNSNKIKENFIDSKNAKFLENLQNFTKMIKPKVILDLYSSQKAKIELFISQDLLNKISKIEKTQNLAEEENEILNIYNEHLYLWS